MFRLPRRWLVPCLSLVTAAAFGLAAQAQQPSDLIKEAKQRQEIATQQAEADMRASIRKADAGGKADALAQLKQTLDRVDGNDEINPTRKADMVRTLKDRIRLMEMSSKISIEPSATPRASARQAELERQKAENEKIREAMKAINSLDGQGRKEEAARQVRMVDNVCVVGSVDDSFGDQGEGGRCANLRERPLTCTFALPPPLTG